MLELDDLLPETHLFLEGLDGCQSTSQHIFHAHRIISLVFVVEVDHFILETIDEVIESIRNVDVT